MEKLGKQIALPKCMKTLDMSDIFSKLDVS